MNTDNNEATDQKLRAATDIVRNIARADIARADIARKQVKQAEIKQAQDRSEAEIKQSQDKFASEQNLRYQIVNSRKRLLNYLILLMVFETFSLFIIVLLNALPLPVLNSLVPNALPLLAQFTKKDSNIVPLTLLQVDSLTLQILVGATITQVSGMMLYVIKSLYSAELNQIMTGNKP